jgi:hypothetical protein
VGKKIEPWKNLGQLGTRLGPQLVMRPVTSCPIHLWADGSP